MTDWLYATPPQTNAVESQEGNMATGPCEVLTRNEECPDSVKDLPVQKESIQQQLKEDRKEDAKTPTNKEEVNGTPNGLEKESGNKLHIIEKDLDEFVDSMTEATPEAPQHLGPEQVPQKLLRAEQVAEKVLRAEMASEGAQCVRKLPGTERGPEKPTQVEKVVGKVPRAEKAPEKMLRTEKVVEKTPRAEKLGEKTRPAGSPALKAISTKRKLAASSTKDTLPWEGLTLNKCILVASFIALLSMGCQVVQDMLDFSDTDVTDAEPGMWTSPESSPQESRPGELEELWFYEKWLSWPEDYEPPEPEEEEEELELVEIEEEEVEPIEIEEEEELTEEEEEPEEPVTKAEPRKSQEKLRERGKAERREKSLKSKTLKDHKAPKEEEEEEEEKKHSLGKHHHQESTTKARRRPQQEEGKSRHPKHGTVHFKEHKRHPQVDGKGRHKEGHDRGEGRPPKHEQDYKHHPHEPKGRKPWHVQRPFFSQKDGAHKFGKHMFLEGKRHD